ncbi:MAG: permease [Chlorobi bacterium]|nr:permease [Chlorobiota bacterium]
MNKNLSSVLKLLLLFIITSVSGENIFAYNNFKVAVYCTRFDVEALSDKAYFDSHIKVLKQTLHVDKVYLEVHRQTPNNLATMLKVKKYFENAGIETAAGITATKPRGNGKYFNILCYSDNNDIEILVNAVKIAAKGFDECIFDDFFFTSCRCDKCIEAKGELSWTDYRLKKMTEVSQLLVSEAKKINPDIKMVIKYPNWYAYYQYTGYNLATEPEIFDGIYSGTETRDRVYTHQNLQPYQSYGIMRYLDNVAPGRNGGGWVDPLAAGNLDTYAQQLALTLFSGTKEITLFNWSSLFKELPDGNLLSVYGTTAASTFKMFDSFAGSLGNPVGLKYYRPVNSSGDSYLASYLGMLGIPVEPVPDFPDKASIVFIPQSASADANVMTKIKSFLKNEGTVIISSGFLDKMRNRGIEEFISSDINGDVEISRVSNLQFNKTIDLKHNIVIPGIENPTNDAWSEIVGITPSGNSYPLLTYSAYSKGSVYLMAVPRNFSDLYNLPAEAIYDIKQRFAPGDVILEAKPEVSLFKYDNRMLIVKSFIDHTEPVILHFKKGVKLYDVINDREITPTCSEHKDFNLSLRANSYVVLKYE